MTRLPVQTSYVVIMQMKTLVHLNGMLSLMKLMKVFN